MRKILKILVYFLLLNSFILLGYLFTIQNSEVFIFENATLTKVIDGDTIETSVGNVRLLGINAPEKNELGYEEAKQFLKEFENKKILLVGFKNKNFDKYKRKLRYVFYKGENLNKELLRRGLAKLYYYEQDSFYEDMEKAEEYARKRGLGIWEKSDCLCAGCIELKKLEPREEYAVLCNKCNFTCNLSKWIIKDDANHKTILNFSLNFGEEKIIYFEKIWNNDKDSFYLRDKKEKLVLFYRYNNFK